jgi:hypothetical protein
VADAEVVMKRCRECQGIGRVGGKVHHADDCSGSPNVCDTFLMNERDVPPEPVR